MVVLMESFSGDMNALSVPHKAQKRRAVTELFRVFDEMGKAGILHCDMKPGNMVQRTWLDKNIDGDAYSWNQIHICPIDFDPFFVKITPWLPWEVLSLINSAQYFAFLSCWGGDPDCANLRLQNCPS